MRQFAEEPASLRWAILTALITSSLVDAAQERRHRFQLQHQETVIRRLTEQFDEMNERIARLEIEARGRAAQGR